MKIKKGKAFKTIRRRAWRIALSHNKLADLTLDSIVNIQKNINIMIDRLDVANPAALPTDFANSKIGPVADWGIFKPTNFENPIDEVSRVQQGHGHRQSLKWALLHALYDEKVSDKYCEAIDSLQQTHDSLCDKLDAQGGTLSATDFASILGMTILNADAPIQTRSKASFRTWMRSSLSSHQLANEFIDSIVECELAINDILAKLDAGTITGVMPDKVNELKPEEDL